MSNQCESPGCQQSQYAAERAEAVDPGCFTGTPFENVGSVINTALDSLRNAIRTGDLDSFGDALNKRSDAIDKILEPYYRGNGSFDSVRFLADLAQTKGSPLSPGEIAGFARVVGEWLGHRLAAEADKQIAEIRARGGSKEEEQAVVTRTLSEALDPLNLI